MAMKKLKKYKNGTGRNGTIANYMETPAEALAENDIDIAKAQYEGESNPWVLGMKAVGNMAMNYGLKKGGFNDGQGADGGNILGNSDKTGNILNSILPLLGNANLALGGTADGEIEAEGDEFVKLPDGSGGTLKGPSHEKGGIDLDVPDNTLIFSDRILKDGDTMAVRASRRQKKLLKMKKNLEKTPGDKILADTIDKTAVNFYAEETKDLAIQDMISFVAGSQGKAMFGLSGEDGLPDILNMMYGGITGKKKAKYGAKVKADLGFDGTRTRSGRGTRFVAPTTGEEEEPFDFANSFGDILGIAGNAFSSVAPYLNTLKNRAEDTPNVNAFKDFGKEGLEKLETAKDYIEGQKDEALGDIDLSKTAGIKRGRNSARSVNTSRALDLATSQQADEAKGNVYNQFAQQTMQLISAEAGALDRRDQAVMTGEQLKDLNDRKDKDNFFTQKSANLVDIGTGIQQTGKDLNFAKQQKMMMKILNQLSKYGITFSKDGELQNSNNTSTD